MTKNHDLALLVELLTRKLPPKALARLMEAFSRVFSKAKEKNFWPAPPSRGRMRPRDVSRWSFRRVDKQPDACRAQGPAVARGRYRRQSEPRLAGIAKSCGVDVAKLGRRPGDKGDISSIHRNRKASR